LGDDAGYRLRGEVAGLVRSYPLVNGENRIGSSGDCDVVLPLRGVSRRHATLRVGSGRLTLEDAQSRNGTFAGAEAVHGRRPVAPGDELRFGPVALRLEQVPSQDAELAIDLAGAPPPAPAPLLGDTAVVAGPEAVAPRPSSHGLVFPDGYVPGGSAAIASLYEQLRPLVQSDLPVLVLGETGVGKECVARILHLSSPRRGGPFVAVNCAAIPTDLLEAEMFGIGRGVATGVVERPGKFQQAQGGTLLLDEIGEMPGPLQAKLLRALQQREVQPVGGAPVAVDIRVVAATNSDLNRRMEEGLFRRDLYYRVAGYALQVPALRERREDLPALVEALLRGFARQAGKAVRGITVRALRALGAYGWPGNVRELEHEVRRLVYLCPQGQAIESAMLSPLVLAALLPVATADPTVSPLEPAAEGASLALDARLAQVERRLIEEALARSGGNRSEAARRLGISRNGLALKLERLGIAD